jgi:MFS family permease
MANGETIESYVPARLDALPWSSWHWLIVVSLGATWILDGLEVTLAGALGGILTRPETLGLTPARVGASATCYLAGAVLGALLFGYGTDRFGRKKLFFVTVAVYLIGTALSAFSWNFWSYALFRAVTGAGIGGEYAAINSAIDELIPARVRGRVDLIINGSAPRLVLPLRLCCSIRVGYQSGLDGVSLLESARHSGSLSFSFAAGFRKVRVG